MAAAITQSANEPARTSFFIVHTVQLKPTVKVQISGRMASIGISDVVTTSVYSEKPHLQKLMLIMQESTAFGGRQKLTSAMK